MFDSLSDRLGGVFDKLRGKGALSEGDVDTAMREIRRALLEADVALPVVKTFIENVREKAVGEQVVKSVKPGEQVVKIVHDSLIETLGSTPQPLQYKAEPLGVILVVGLQGSGKTTSTAKIGKFLNEKKKQKVLMASLDVQRPAAQEQLAVLGEQAHVTTLPIVAGQQPVDITKRALDMGRKEGYDVVLLDTAGRLHIDEELMAEVAAVSNAANPTETLLVADAMMGQDAANIAKSFHEKIGISGIVLTRVDGDARGGAALSMQQVTGQPIKLLGAGEKIDALEEFDAQRIAGRILGMGDVVSLVEKAVETIDEQEAEKMAARMEKGKFDLNDLLAQLRNMKKMGGMQSILGLLPGMGKVKKLMSESSVDDSVFKRQEAIILSMTKKERSRPEMVKASRKKRIAGGSGTTVQDVNKLLKQFFEMQKMMKRLKKMGGMKALMKSFGGGGDLPPGGGLPPGFPPLN